MACLIDSGVARSCNYNVSGNSNFYLANLTDVDTITVDLTGTVTAITMVATKKFYEFQFENETAQFMSKFTNSNGNKYFAENVTFSLAGLDQDKLNIYESLGLSDIIVIAKRKDGKAFILGRNGGLQVQQMDNDSGKAKGDFSGTIVNLEGASITIMAEVDPTIIPALLL